MWYNSAAMTNTKTILQFETFADVAEHVERNEGDIEVGFEDAEREDLCIDDLKEALHKGGLTPGDIKRVEIKVAFVEFDSSNWTHAQARFDVTLKVPADLIADVRDCFQQELEVFEE